MVEQVATHLAARGHTVHIVANDAEQCEQRAPSLFFWTSTTHPTHADCVVAVQGLQHVSPDSGYRAPLLVLMSNGIDPYLGPDDDWAKGVDGYPCFSQSHVELMTGRSGAVDRDRCFLTGLGIELDDYGSPFDPGGGLPIKPMLAEGRKVPGRIFVSNDPARGLHHVLSIFEKVRERVPSATLHIGYDFDRAFEQRRWGSHALTEMMWWCRDRIDTMPGVVSLGALTRQELIAEQLAAEVHLWPSDPPNTGSQIHGLTQAECAAAGCALVLSDIEAFPEVFGAAATILPIPGAYLPQLERRYNYDDWAEAVVRLLTDAEAWSEASRKARAVAETMDWESVVDRWEEMLTTLEGRARAAARPVEELEREMVPAI